MHPENPRKQAKWPAALRSPTIVVAIVSSIMVMAIGFSVFNIHEVTLHHTLPHTVAQDLQESLNIGTLLLVLVATLSIFLIIMVRRYEKQQTIAIQKVREAEDAQRLSKAHYQSLFDNSPAPLWDDDFTQLYAHFDELKAKGISNFREYFDNNPNEMVGCIQKIEVLNINQAALRLHQARDQEHLIENIEKIFSGKSLAVFKEEIITLAEGGLSFESDAEVKTISGEPRQIALKLTVTKDELGTVRGLLVTMDITAERELEEQLRQSQKMESVGRLAGGVAHDFNNMLGVIIGHTEFALEDLGSSHPVYTDLQEIHEAAKRSALLTRQLLAFARKQTVSPKQLNLNDTVTGMLSMLKKLIGEQIDFSWSPGTKLGTVEIDPSQIDQILTNLCINARDAIEITGEISIQTKNITLDESACRQHPDFAPGDYIMLSVSDTGSGIDAETLPLIFEPFFTTRKVGDGTGLGLSTVYGIIKQNNGFITVQSEPGVGSTFEIYLPRKMGQIKKVEAKPKQEVPNGRGETILLVEDEAPVIRMISKILKKLGYQVLATTTSDEAIEMGQHHGTKIDLLLTDVVMPKLSGQQLAERLGATHPQLKQLFMSGYTADIIATHGILEEGINFIQKPFSREQLAFKIREVLDGKQET